MNTEAARMILRATLEVVGSEEVPEVLLPEAFSQVFNLILGDPSNGFRASPAGALLGSSEGGNAQMVGEAGAATMKIAEGLGVRPADVERLFLLHEGQLRFEGPAGQLGRNKTEMVSKIALLLIAARQAGELDLGLTADEEIRREIDRLGLLDTSNYSKQIGKLTPYVSIIGAGKSANYKIKYDGRAEARNIAKALLGPDSVVE